MLPQLIQRMLGGSRAGHASRTAGPIDAALLATLGLDAATARRLLPR